MLKDKITDEQILKICLDYESTKDYSLEGLTGELIVLYCMCKIGVGETLEKVQVMVEDLCVQHAIEKLVECGHLVAHFTESGVEYKKP